MTWRSYKPGDLRAVHTAVDRSERCQSAFLQEHQPFQVVACRLELQGEGDPDDTHAAHQLAAHLRQRAEHVLDTGAWCGDTAVALLLCIGDTLVALPLSWISLDMHTPAILFQLRLPFGGGVTAISMYIAAGIAAVQQRLKYCGVGHGGMRDGYFAR